MKIKLLIAVATILCFTACNKDKFTTKPQLKFKSVNADIFPKGSQVSFTLTVTDKEGDIKDTLWVERVSKVCPDLRSLVVPYELPDFLKTKSLEADFIVTYNYGTITPPSIDGCPNKDDSSYFRFWIKDKADNTSDTVQSPLLLLLN